MVFFIKGIKFRLEFSFLLIIAFALLINAENILYLILFASLHEAGHITALLVFDCKPKSITLAFYGIGMKYNSYLSNGKELIVTLCGPFLNLLFILLSIHREVNFPLFIINILPVYPLDGGRALSLITGDKTAKAISVITLSFLPVLSLITLNISLLLICIYLIIFLISRIYLYD